MKKEYTCLGLMSGTSGDGVDASIVRSDGQDKFTVIKERYYEYDKSIFYDFHELKNKINSYNDLNTHSLKIKELEKKITLFNAKIIKDISSNITLDLIGFHGQTIYHNPDEKISNQLGNGILLSQLTKIKTVFNFRKNDILNGGEGAPLTPIFHKYLIKSKKINLPAAILNIGGISNMTYLYDFKDNKILSKDLGPGNCLIDQWIQKHTKKKFDDEGKISERGIVNEIILEQALELYENNFKKKNNISLDTNDFDLSFARGLSIEDGAATLIKFTSKIIASNIDLFLKDFLNKNIKVIICGGGRKNLNLIKQIKLYTNKNLSFYSSEEYSLEGDFIESQAFAYLAIRSVLSLPISFPQTTGCSSPCTGGEIINY